MISSMKMFSTVIPLGMILSTSYLLWSASSILELRSLSSVYPPIVYLILEVVDYCRALVIFAPRMIKEIPRT